MITTRQRLPSLGAYLVIIMLVASVPLAAMLAYQLFLDMQAQHQRLHENLQRSTAALAASVERELAATVDELTSLARTLQRAPDRRLPALQRALQEQPRPANWQTLVLRAAPAGPAAATVSDLLGEQDSLGTVVEVPLAIDGEPRYALSARIDASHWQSLVQSGGAPPNGLLAIVGRDGRLIARSDAPRLIGQAVAASALATMAADTDGTQRAALADGGLTYGAWQPSPLSGWGVSARVFAAPIDSAQRRAVLTALATTTACLLLGVALATLLARRVTEPLAQLATRGPALPTPPVVHEIAQLRDALAVAQEQEARSRSHLQRKADEFQALFSSTPVGLAFMPDAASPRVVHNAAMQALVGTADDGTPSAVQVFDQGRLLGAHEQPLRRAADSGCEIGPLELELRSAGQPTRHVLVRALPLQGRAQNISGAVAAVVDITERKLAERERLGLVDAAQAARRLAEAASRAKDEFLAMLGHELRNPLGAIASAVEILNRVDAGAEAAVNARLIIGRQTRHLAHLMDDLLDVGRVVSGKVRLARQRLELGALVERVVANFDVSSRARNHDLRLALEQTWVCADATRIEQVVSNLLGNAFKYTPPGQRIDVTLTQRDHRAVLEVRDRGPGIAPELLPRIFELFVQGEQSIDRPGGGLGIGLTLVRRLVELHGGEVRAHSSPAGTSILVCLPAVDAPPLREPRAAEPLPRTQRVLVVEDNADALSVLKIMLELDGHVVSTAADGERGLALLLGERPDAAIVDIGLPGLSGHEVALRGRRAGYAGKLFALSGYSGSQDVDQARRNGFDAHLAKPLDTRRLRALLTAS